MRLGFEATPPPNPDAGAELASDLEQIEGRGPGWLSPFDSARGLGRLAPKLSGDGVIDADDVRALVREAKDFGGISGAERGALIRLLREEGGRFTPDARAGLEGFLGLAEQVRSRAEVLRHMHTAASDRFGAGRSPGAIAFKPEVLAPPPGGWAEGERVELKAMVTEASFGKLKDLLGIRERDAEKREVTFYDTQDLSLFERGVVLRARKVKGGADDSTVKIRPFDPGRVDPEWFDEDGFKAETDCTGDRSVRSCSVKSKQGRGEIDAVAEGERDVDKLFSKDQERFLKAYAGGVDFDAVRPLGPVDTSVWEVDSEELGCEVTVERWRLPDGRELYEVSTKAEPEVVGDTAEAFAKLLNDAGIEPSSQGTKTRTTLEHFSGRG